MQTGLLARPRDVLRPGLDGWLTRQDFVEPALVWRRCFLLEMLAKALDDDRAGRVETLLLKLRAHVERGEYA